MINGHGDSVLVGSRPGEVLPRALLLCLKARLAEVDALEDLGEARRAASARLDELRHEVADLVSGGA